MNEKDEKIRELEEKIKQIHKDYGCEIRDPNGTIWEFAAKLQAELASIRERASQRNIRKFQHEFNMGIRGKDFPLNLSEYIIGESIVKEG